MAKKIVNSDIYNLSKLVDDVKSVFIPDENEETLAISTYGYIGALESHRLQTQVQMTGELCNEVFPSRARLDRNVITHAIMTNIENINAIPAKMTAFLAIRESDILDLFDDGDGNSIFIIDRDCPIYIGDYEFHLEYDIKLTKIYIQKKATNAYTAQYDIPPDRDVPTSTINDSNRYLNPPAVIMVNNEAYIYLTVVLRQVEHIVVSKKLVTSNIVDNKTINFEFDSQLAYFEVHCEESDQDYYITPVFEGSSVPEGNAKYYCWYQYIDTNLIRVRFDRNSYMPGLNTNVECLIKTCQGDGGNFSFSEDVFVDLESKKYGYKNISAMITPVSDSMFGKDRKSKRELQSLIPKEALARGCLTTITDLNNYFGMLDSELGRIIIQKKIDNQIERVYYAYFVAKDMNGDIIPSNTVDIEVGLEDLIESRINEIDSSRYLLPHGMCFHLCDDGIARINHRPILDKGYKFTPDPIKRGDITRVDFDVEVSEDYEYPNQVSCGVDIGGSHTRTHVYPAKGDDRFYCEDPYIGPTIVEDYLQMGFGRSYIYTGEYITKFDNSLITAKDLGLECFDFVDGYYTAEGTTRHFDKLPVIAYGFPKGTKIIFCIVNKLNIHARGIITFNYGNKVHKLHQSWKTKLSTVLKGLGFLGDVKDAISLNEDVVKLTENGLITEDGEVVPGPNPGPDIKPDPEPDPGPIEIIDPFTKKVVDKDVLPGTEDRKKNEWYWVINNKEVLPDKPTVDAIESIINKEGIPKDPFTLKVVTEDELPPIRDRKKNEWYYIVSSREDPIEIGMESFEASSNTYHVHVVTEEDLPPVGQRGTDEDWYLVVTKIKKLPDVIDPDPIIPDPPPKPIPPSPTVLSGKDYDVEILRNFEDEKPVITVTIDDKTYDIFLEQDRFNVENTITISENGHIQETTYLTYVPVLEQNVWPDELEIGDRIHYTLRYKSSGISYKPDLVIELSRGLKYVDFSNWITYPGKDPIQIEPTEVSLMHKRGFLYTNPYSVNINGYRLYSAFYMMSMSENPYLHFNFINQRSYAQFIATNVYWNRPFYNKNGKRTYTLSVSLTQSVQDNIGLINPEDPDATPLIKVYAVFYRDGVDAPYRYRSMRLTGFDPGEFTFNFSQEFYSEDIFDNDNNVKITNTQVTKQSEYSTTLTYNGKSVNIGSGASVKLRNILGALDIRIDELESAESSDRLSLDVTEVRANNKIVDYNVQSFNEFVSIDGNDGFITVTGTNHIINTEDPSKPTISEKVNVSIGIESTHINQETEYGFFNPNTKVRLYVLCGLPEVKRDKDGNVISTEYNQYQFRDICPDLKSANPGETNNWTLVNVFDVVNGVTFYHNYSEIMGSRVTPYGRKYIDENNNTVMKLEGYRVKSIPMLGYDYCKDEILVQNAINALNYRKAYIDNALIKLENSFGIDFKLFNTYGPSKTYYILRDMDKNGLLDQNAEFIDRVNLSLFFRVKLVSATDSYTKDNIIKEIKEYIEDLNDLGQLHIPNLITQITTNYKEQINYFEYLGFNNYGAEIQHIYKLEDEQIPIHVAPEFLCVNNTLALDGITHPDISIYISEI